MNKKGFTLLELLAVIVVLAILALIATPIIINLINDSKKSTTLLNANNYAEAVEISISNFELTGKKIKNGTYSIMSSGDICLGELNVSSCDGEVLEIQASGNKPNSGSIEIKEGTIESAEFILDNDKIVQAPGGDFVYETDIPITGKEYENGEIVFYDVKGGKSCPETMYHPDNSIEGYKATEEEMTENENQTSCLQFYAFGDDGEKVKLLLDHNTSEEVTLELDNDGAEIFDIQQLSLDTSSWNKDNDIKIRLLNLNDIVTIFGFDSSDDIVLSMGSAIYIEEEISWLRNTQNRYFVAPAVCYHNDLSGMDCNYYIINDSYFQQENVLVGEENTIVESVRPVIEVKKEVLIYN